MDYRDFSVEDLVLDPFFRSWVKGDVPAAGKFWDNWLLDNPDRAPDVEEARELVRYLHFATAGPSASETKMVKLALAEKISRLEARKNRGWGRLFSFSYPLAAAIVLLLIAALAVIYLLPPSKQRVFTAYGQTREVTLPDGSLVTLNANSSISYHKDWAENGREVWLEGEAFFKVRKKTAAPDPSFSVHAGSLLIKVLGTSFNVYNRAEKTAVVLQEGRVALSSVNGTGLPRHLVMKPGDKVEVNGDDYKHEQVAVEPYLSWREQRLVFENTSLAEIARLLEDNYGYRVVFNDPDDKNLRFTGSYSSKRIDLFLKALGEAFGIQLTVADKTITIQ